MNAPVDLNNNYTHLFISIMYFCKHFPRFLAIFGNLWQVFMKYSYEEKYANYEMACCIFLESVLLAGRIWSKKKRPSEKNVEG